MSSEARCFQCDDPLDAADRAGLCLTCNESWAGGNAVMDDQVEVEILLTEDHARTQLLMGMSTRPQFDYDDLSAGNYLTNVFMDDWLVIGMASSGRRYYINTEMWLMWWGTEYMSECERERFKRRQVLPRALSFPINIWNEVEA
jgi:hypothetical protein